MNGTNTPSFPVPSLPDGVDAAGASGIRYALSTLSFWAAIALPSVYVPLLVFGIDAPDGLATFLLLFGLHLVALVGGRHYRGTAGR